MIAAYGPYAASATGGNDLARDFLAGIAALYSSPCKISSQLIQRISWVLTLHTVYTNVGDKYKLEYPSTILACLSVIVIIPIYIFYWKGPQIREKSKFAQELNAGRKQSVARRRSTAFDGKALQNEKNARHVENV